MRRHLRKRAIGRRLIPASQVKSVPTLVRFNAEARLRGKPKGGASPEEVKTALRRTLNINTMSIFRSQNLANYKANSPILKQAQGIREIDGICKGTPAIIVASGPSLDRNIHELHRAVGKIPIFACDASLPMLAAEGIEPDYAMVVDVTAKQAKFFECVKPNTKTILLALPCSHPDVLAAWPGRVLFFNTFGSEKDEAIQLENGQDFGSIGVGGNVSTALFWLAGMFCEAKQLILIGHDFSFDPCNYYASNGIHQLAAKKPRYPTWDINGDSVQTEITLWGYKDYTEEWARDLKPLGYRTINASEGGILGTTEVYGKLQPYIEQRRLSETLDEFIGTERPVDHRAPDAPAPAGEQVVSPCFAAL